MSQDPIDLKLFAEVKEHFTRFNHDASESHRKAGTGAFQYFAFPMMPKHDYDEVYPGILLGNNKCVKNYDQLKKMGVTHMLNASMGPKFNQTDTDQTFYNEDWAIKFHGIPALDVITFKMLPYLRPAAEFIDKALTENGKVYVHCQQGISRSATVVIAFLMICRDMGLVQAINHVRACRMIFPNDGFLKQLCVLQKQLLDEIGADKS